MLSQNDSEWRIATGETAVFSEDGAHALPKNSST